MALQLCMEFKLMDVESVEVQARRACLRMPQRTTHVGTLFEAKAMALAILRVKDSSRAS